MCRRQDRRQRGKFFMHWMRGREDCQRHGGNLMLRVRGWHHSWQGQLFVHRVRGWPVRCSSGANGVRCSADRPLRWWLVRLLRGFDFGLAQMLGLVELHGGALRECRKQCRSEPPVREVPRWPVHGPTQRCRVLGVPEGKVPKPAGRSDLLRLLRWEDDQVHRKHHHR